MKSALTVLLALYTIAASAQSHGTAQVFTADQIKQDFAQALLQSTQKGSGGNVLADYGNHNLRISTRTSDGGAEVHAHFADVFYVTAGNATLLIGGTVIDGTTSNDGETLGKSLKDGVPHKVGPGDLIHIAAGVPHQLLIPKGTVFNYLVVKVKD